MKGYVTTKQCDFLLFLYFGAGMVFGYAVCAFMVLYWLR